MNLPRFGVTALLLGSLLSGAPANGQEVALDVSLDFTKATERILAQDAQLELALAQLRAAEAEVPMASASVWDRPELRVGGINSADIEAGSPGLDVAIRSPIPRPGDGKRARAQVKGGVASAAADVATTRWALEVEVRRAFQELALLDDEIRLLERLSQARGSVLEAWRLSLEEGATTELEVIRAELQAAEAADDLAEAQGRRLNLEAAIRRWAAVEGDTPLTPGAPALPESEDPGAWIQMALDTRPDVQASKATISAAEAALSQARYDNLPWFDFVQGGYEWSGESATGDMGAQGALTLGFAFTLPRLTTGRAGIPFAVAEVESAKAEARSLEADVEEEIRRAARLLQAAKERGQRLETGTLEAATRGIKKAEQALEEGRLSRQDVLSFQADATSLSLRRLSLREDEIDAEAALLLAIGGPIKQEILDGPLPLEER